MICRSAPAAHWLVLKSPRLTLHAGPRVEGPSQIVDERRQAELGADLVEAAHEKGALVHPLLDRPGPSRPLPPYARAHYARARKAVNATKSLNIICSLVGNTPSDDEASPFYTSGAVASVATVNI